MKNIKLLCFLFTLFALDCFSQEQTIIPREKVHLHLDRYSYAAGDTIWFKSYVVLAGKNELSGLSKVLHIDFIDPGLKVLKSLVIPLNMGLSAGDLVLPDSLKDGHYRIRAYTNWMHNFGESTFFDKVIPILNGYAGGTTRPNTQTAAVADVQFFPEGGELVTGLRSKVGVKITGSNGFGQQAEGEVLDPENNQVAVFSTNRLGIGAFAHNPQPGITYTARVRIKGEKDQLVKLPSPRDMGLVMIVNNRESDSIFVTLNRSPEATQRVIELRASGDQQIYYSIALRMEGMRYSLSIPRNQLPLGVSRLTLFANGEEYAERLILNNHGGQLDIRVSSLKNKFSPGENSQIMVQTSQNGSESVNSSLSMSVTNVSRVPHDEDSELSIMANLLLASDLKGYIEQPNYYFNSTQAETILDRATELDNLLLTQGWRKIWRNEEEIRSLRFDFPPEQGLSITGKLVHQNRKSVSGSRLSLFATIDNLPFLMDTLTNEDGSFQFEGLDYDDNTPFVIQSKDVKNKLLVKVVLDSVRTPAVLTNPTIPHSRAADSLINQLAKTQMQGIPGKFRPQGMYLDEVVVTEKKKIYSSSPGGREFSDKVIDQNLIKGRHNLMSAISLAEPNIRFDGNNQPRYLGQRFKITEFITEIDGLRVDNGILTTLLPEEVESIELLMSGANTVAYTDASGNPVGLIVINTKSRDPNRIYSNVAVPGMKSFRPKGYTRLREFYTPKYQPSPDKPYLADVVYWNPEIEIDSSKPFMAEFINSSRPGFYRVIVEGVDLRGKMGRSVFTYEVN